jgi:hypothetical protein
MGSLRELFEFVLLDPGPSDDISAGGLNEWLRKRWVQYKFFECV